MRFFYLFLALCLLLAACGTLPSGRPWGKDATISPGWERIRRAAADAALSPSVWIPAAGAAGFGLTGMDREVSEWASEKTPLFGSRRRADKASDDLRNASTVLYIGTALAAPSGSEPGGWAGNKLKGLSTGAGAVVVTSATAGALKIGLDRTRPNGGHGSLPSFHASQTAAWSMLTARNVEHLPIPRAGRNALHAANAAIDLSAAWSRVEAGQHFPSDVLAGMALGHFVSAVVSDAFLIPPSGGGPSMGLLLVPTPSSITIRIGFGL